MLLKIAGRIGDRAGEMAQLCGCLPLALRLAGSVLAERVDLSPARYLERLRDAQTRLGLVEGSLSLSYELLSQEQQRLWCLLAVFPTTFDARAVPPLWEMEADLAQTGLSELVRYSLVEWNLDTARYHLHDLARLFAASRLGEDDRAAGQRRHAAHYETVLRAANELYLRGGESLLRGLALFDLEWDNVQAGQAWAAGHAHRDDAASQLCQVYPDAGVYYLNLRLHAQEWIRWLEAALDAARRLKGRAAEGAHLGNLGTAYSNLGEVGRAIEYYEQALHIAREIGDRRGEGADLGNLGLAYSRLGEVGRAIEYHEQALHIAREIGDRRGEGAHLGNLGLEYVAEALNAAGHHVEVLDLCWADDWHSAIAGFLDGTSFDLVGVTLRNTDDCAFTSRQSFLGEFADVVSTIRKHTDALIVLGGVGFSVMPKQVLKLCEADAGVWGEGEFALVELANRIEGKLEWRDLPNLVWRRDGEPHRNPPSAPSLTDLPPMRRRWVDNWRYFCEGGQAGIETKRGCPGHCVYCADPVAKGGKTRVRPPEAVVDELERLLEQGIDHIHTCDSEFNLPEWHASEVCREIIRRDLGDKLRWYAYCSPVPFSQELAKLMCDAGCVEINFGVDSGDEEMLRRLRRDFAPNDILKATRSCKETGIAVMLDLLLGSPGETKESLVRTIELMRCAGPDQVGIALGVRVYPGTELANLMMPEKQGEGLVGGDDPLEPLFFIEPRIATFAFELLDDLIGDDRRFFFFDPSRPDRNYNYNANQRLVDAIKEGYRGAYWDILRRYE